MWWAGGLKRVWALAARRYQVQRRQRVVPRKITQGLAQITCADGAAHDLAVAGLGQARHEVDPRGRHGLSDHFRDGGHQSLAPQPPGVGARYDKSNYLLALDIVRYTDDSRLGNAALRHQGRLYFGRADTTAANLERIVRAPVDVPETVAADAGQVAMQPDIRRRLQ